MGVYLPTLYGNYDRRREGLIGKLFPLSLSTIKGNHSQGNGHASKKIKKNKRATDKVLLDGAFVIERRVHYYSWKKYKFSMMTKPPLCFQLWRQKVPNCRIIAGGGSMTCQYKLCMLHTIIPKRGRKVQTMFQETPHNGKQGSLHFQQKIVHEII